MLVKSQALVLKKTPYSDNSAIVQILTRSHGQQAFMVQGLHGKSGKLALYQAGNLIEIVFYNQANKGIKRIKEIRNLSAYSPSNLNPLKQQVMMYCLEIIYASSTEGFFDPLTFDYIVDFLFDLQTTSIISIKPHQFVLEYSKLAGHGIDLNPPAENFRLDIQGGYYYRESDEHIQIPYFNFTEVHVLKTISEKLPDYETRKNLLEKLSLYARHHVMNGKELKTLKILTEISD